MSLQSTNQKIKITLQENKQHRRLNKSILLSICFKHVCLPINRINFANFINKCQLQTIFLQTLGGIPPLGYKELDSVSAVFFFFFTVLTSTLRKWASPRKNRYYVTINMIELQANMYKWVKLQKSTSRYPVADIVLSHSLQLSTCCKHLYTRGSWSWLPRAHSSQDGISCEGFQWDHPC